MEAYKGHALKHRGENYFGMSSNPSVAETLLKALLPDLETPPSLPVIVIYKNFGNKEEDTALVYGNRDEDDFSPENIEKFIKDYNFRPLSWVNSSGSDNEEAGLGKRELPVAHLWIDSSRRHPETIKMVRRA